MEETKQDNALIGTDAIKAFLKKFDDIDPKITRIIVEELLICLLKEKKYE